MKNYQLLLEDFLQVALDENASDLHISVGHYPILRINGKLVSMSVIRDLDLNEKISSEDSREIAMMIMNEKQKKNFTENCEADFSYNYKNIARVRVNVFVQSGEVSCAMRIVPGKISSLEELGMPPALYDFCNASQGFVLVTGPTRHGKTTTLATLIEYINRNRFCHIITIEDPIEYVFKDGKALIDQREVNQDVSSFSSALRSVFRQDPDVIMIGEMRDPETITMAMTAAETGHLVFSTLHTNSASQTINRIIDSFPSEQQNQVRAQLSTSLKGVISQRLIPSIKGGIVPACEIMIMNAAVANLIRENKTHEIDMVIETSGESGMIGLNKSLLSLVREGEISMKNALIYSLYPSELKRMIR